MFDQEVSPAARTRAAAADSNLRPAEWPASTATPFVREPPVAGPDPGPSPKAGSNTGRPIRLLRAAILMVVVGAVIIAIRINDLLPGAVTAAGFVLLVLAIPTSAQLSRRILLAGCLFFGWVPILYWVDLPVGELGRSTLLLAAIAALLVGWIAAGRDPGRRLRRLVPRLQAVDGLPLLAVVAAGAVLWKWIQAKSGVAALAIMIPGWDHSAHYAMTHSIRLHGVTTQGLAATAGQGSPFDGYPQSFHAAVAAVMELLASAAPGTAESEISLYTQAVGLILVAAVGMLTAGLCALPSLRRRPALALPLVALVASAFILGPGGSALQDGFPNLLLATALVAAIPLLTVSLGRLFSPLHLAALGGAVVGIAHGWAPLLLLAAPGVLVALVPWRARRWQTTRRAMLLSALVVAATALCVAWAAIILIGIPLAALAAPGGVSAPALGLAIFFTFGCLGSCLLIGQSGPHLRKGLPGPTTRTAWLAATPIVGLVGAAALGGYQLATVDEVSYYFWKFIAALGLVCIVVLSIGLAVLVGNRARHPVRRIRTAIAAGALSVAVTQLFGFAGPNLPSIDIPPNAPGATARDASERLIREPPWTANMIRDVDSLVEQFPGQPVFYISAPSDGRTRGYSMTQWFLGLTSTWTLEAQATVEDAQLEDDTFTGALEAAERVLRASPDNIVAVGPDIVQDIRQLLDRELADRVVSWTQL